jgi:thiamine-phosphate pyrophosphorylase
MNPNFDLKLCLILDPDLCGPDEGMIKTANAGVAGGATMVQLRHKSATTQQRIEIGLKLKAALTNSLAKLIINDDLEAAFAIGADGLHIGQSDGDPIQARNRLGAEAIIGLSAESAELVQRIDAQVVDYAGLGPVFATPTKSDHKTPIGFEGLRSLASICPVPSVAIGGLTAEHADSIFSAGCNGMAVISAICGKPDPLAAAWEINSAIAKARR